MKYEQPNLEIILMGNMEIVFTSNVTPEGGIPPLGEDEEPWE